MKALYSINLNSELRKGIRGEVAWQRILLRAAMGLATVLVMLPFAVWAAGQSEVPAGTRFVVELEKKLDANKVKRGKRFEARTLEALQTADGRVIPAGSELDGRVGEVSKREMQLRFEEIHTPWGRTPLVARVVAVPDEKGVKATTDDEGDIQASGGGHKKHAVVGGLVGAGIGAAVGGATQGGASGVGKGAAIGGATGGLIGATKGGHRLVLERGARLEVELDRPLVLLTENYER